MTQYCLDTSAWMDGWVRDYPPDVFPSIWKLLDEEIERNVIKASEEVYVEIEKKDDSLHRWFKNRKKVLIPLEEHIQYIAKELLSEYPRLVDTFRNRSQADPFVIATASYIGGVVVTGEVPSGNLNKPKIPDVCNLREIRCINFLGMLRELEWKF